MGIKIKITLYLLISLIIIGMLYLSIEFFFPRDFGFSGSIDGNTVALKLEKSKQLNQYYISLHEQEKGNVEIKLECTKEQYALTVA